jgi:hypothetical protein
MSDFLTNVVKRGTGLTSAPRQAHAESPELGLEELVEAPSQPPPRAERGGGGRRPEGAARPAEIAVPPPPAPALVQETRASTPENSVPAQVVSSPAPAPSIVAPSPAPSPIETRSSPPARELIGVQRTPHRDPPPEPPRESHDSTPRPLAAAALEPQLRAQLARTVSPAARIVWPALPATPPAARVDVHIGRVEVINPPAAAPPSPPMRRVPAGFDAFAAVRRHWSRRW